jgi:anion transporter
MPLAINSEDELESLPEAPPAAQRSIAWYLKLVVVFLIFCACIGIYFAPIMKDQVPARHCLALLIFIVSLWATELFPIWATSLMIPILVVWLQVYPDPNAHHATNAESAVRRDGAPLGTSQAAYAVSIVFSKFFSSAVMLALGAFTMSAALTKYQWSDRLAFLVLSRVGQRPWVITLTVMFLGVFLSMWVSNVAAPVVVLSLVRPLLEGIPEEDTFNKVILLGIAFSNNIGGMTTPIASPQNIVAIQNIQARGENIGWLKWLVVALPYAATCTLAAFAFLWIFYRPKLAEVPKIRPRQLNPMGWKALVVLFVCFSTILLWALSSLTADFTGDNGITALIPVVVFCALKLMTKEDFKNLSWDVLVLLGGGLVLGSAIDKSGLLGLIAAQISKIVQGQSTWVVMAAFASLTWFFGNFMSHTVAAIIITPVVVSVACPGTGTCPPDAHMVLLTVAAVLVDSGAMALPMTSFPNAATYNETKRDGKPYLDSADFIKTGFPVGIIELLLLFSVGFGLFQLWHVFGM